MNIVHFKSTSALSGPLLALVLALATMPAPAADGLSEASELSAIGVASIVMGSLEGVGASAELVVESAERVGDGLRVVLRGSERGVRTVLLLPVKASGALSLVAGEIVVLIAEGGGWLLLKAGQVIAYVPRETGKALLFSTPASR